MTKKILFFIFFSVIQAFKPLSSFYYPIFSIENKNDKKIKKIDAFEESFVCYPQNNTYIFHTDICPHQGASLSKGWINKNGNLQCPYHGFEFCSGMFCKIPNPKHYPPYFRSKIKLKTYPTIIQKNMVFVSFNETMKKEPIFFPKEEYNPIFRKVEGSQIIDKNYKVVCENLLDMLHISYVHSFGNPLSPLPFSIRYEELSDIAGRTTFLYEPRNTTISKKVGGVSKVIVENEFHLPTNTITRVKAGSLQKTVFTRSLPISQDKTLLFWVVYRNYWIDPFFSYFSKIGDVIMKKLMEWTLEEDIKMLKDVYSEYREGPLKTKYDITIQKFRKMVDSFEQFHYTNRKEK